MNRKEEILNQILKAFEETKEKKTIGLINGNSDLAINIITEDLIDKLNENQLNLLITGINSSRIKRELLKNRAIINKQDGYKIYLIVASLEKEMVEEALLDEDIVDELDPEAIRKLLVDKLDAISIINMLKQENIFSRLDNGESSIVFQKILEEIDNEDSLIETINLIKNKNFSDLDIMYIFDNIENEKSKLLMGYFFSKAINTGDINDLLETIENPKTFEYIITSKYTKYLFTDIDGKIKCEILFDNIKANDIFDILMKEGILENINNSVFLFNKKTFFSKISDTQKLELLNKCKLTQEAEYKIEAFAYELVSSIDDDDIKIQKIENMKALFNAKATMYNHLFRGLKSDQKKLTIIESKNLSIDEIWYIIGGLNDDELRLRKSEECLNTIYEKEEADLNRDNFFDSFLQLLRIPEDRKQYWLTAFKNKNFEYTSSKILFAIKDENFKIDELSAHIDFYKKGFLSKIITSIESLDLRMKILEKYYMLLTDEELIFQLKSFDDGKITGILNRCEDISGEVLSEIISSFKSINHRTYFLAQKGKHLNLKQKAKVIMTLDSDTIYSKIKTEYINLDVINLIGEELKLENIYEQASEEYIKFLAILLTLKLGIENNINLSSVLFDDIKASGGDYNHYLKRIRISNSKLACVYSKRDQIYSILQTIFHEINHAIQFKEMETPLSKSILSYETLRFVKDKMLDERNPVLYEANYFIKSYEADSRAKEKVQTHQFVSQFNSEFADKKKREQIKYILNTNALLGNNLRLVGKAQEKYPRIKDINEFYFLNYINMTSEKVALDKLFDYNFNSFLLSHYYISKYPVLLLEYHKDGVKKTNDEIFSLIDRCDRILGNVMYTNTNKEKIRRLKETYLEIILNRKKYMPFIEESIEEKVR